MEARTNWGIVAFAGAFAVLAIGVAISSAYFSDEGPAPIAALSGGTTADYINAPWQDALASIAKPTTDAEGNYSAPSELSVTQGLSRELFIKYLQLKQDGSLSQEEVQQGIADLLGKNISPITATKVYAESNIKASASVSIDSYAGALGKALAPSAEIKEYELVLFSRSVARKDYIGSSDLAAAASIYRGVERDLLAMSVPNTLVKEHLELLQSVQMLAQTTELLARWGGDPVDALAYIDAFTKAERSVQVAINSLFARITVVAKQS